MTPSFQLCAIVVIDVPDNTCLRYLVLSVHLCLQRGGADAQISLCLVKTKNTHTPVFLAVF